MQMGAKSVFFALFLAITVVLSMNPQASARCLKGANHELLAESGRLRSYQSTKYENLDEIDRLKLSINKIICGSMEDGCAHMDDAEGQSDTTDHSAESFANLNPHEYVKEY